LVVGNAEESLWAEAHAQLGGQKNMMGCFAVFPDGAGSPAAIFEDLEDAMDWGLKRYGDDAFGIRYLEMAKVERAESRGAPGPD
jgi:hypothetical protein